MQEDIDAFLRLWGEPTAAELRLWSSILAPLGDRVVPVMTEWARRTERKPHPRELVELAANSAATGQMSKIAAEIAASYGVTVSELREPDKHGDMVRPRQHVMFALRQAGYSMTRIGKFLNRDHTTVMYGAKAHAGRVQAGV
jgi:hypothetical protein